MVAKINKKKYDGHAIACFIVALIAYIFGNFFKSVRVGYIGVESKFFVFGILSLVSLFLGIIATIEIKHSDKLRGDSLAWIGITLSIVEMLSWITIRF